MSEKQYYGYTVAELRERLHYAEAYETDAADVFADGSASLGIIEELLDENALLGKELDDMQTLLQTRINDLERQLLNSHKEIDTLEEASYRLRSDNIEAQARIDDLLHRLWLADKGV